MNITLDNLFSLVDFTSLNEDDNSNRIAAFCLQARQPFADAAAVCIYPRFVPQVRAALPETIAVATVVNFPTGAQAPSEVFAQTRQAIADGADEIDMVFPYRAFADRQVSAAEALTAEVAAICHEHGKILKVILETGALAAEDICAAARAAIQCGADFLKTSTGKIARGASLEDTLLLLNIIAETAHPVGLKISGGVRDVAAAMAYVHQAETVMGKAWVNPQHFRIGASALLSDILEQIKG